jgi:hypothetical protein
MFTINMGHPVSGATIAQPIIESAGYVKKRMAHGKYFEIPRRGFSFGNPIYRALAGAILVPLTHVAHGPRPINGGSTVF